MHKIREQKDRTNRMGKETVLILSPFFRPNIGGAETHLNDLCEYLREHRHRVFIITYQPLTTKAKGQKIEKKKNLEIRRIQWFGYNLFPKLEPYPFIEWMYLFPGLFIYSLFFLLKHRGEISVIHAHGLIASFIVKVLAKLFNKRSVMSIHAIYYLDEKPLFAKIVGWILRSFDVILGLAERSKKDLINAGVPEKKLKIYTQWVNQNKFVPLNKEQCKRQLDLNYDFIVLFIGRLIEKKGIKVLVKAAPLVNPDIKFVVIGDGSLSDEVKKISLERRNFLFLGKVAPDNTVEYYNAADIFVIPSQYEEGFARVVLEALSCGTPIISANKGCLPEMLTPSVSLLIEPTVKNIAEKIEYLFKNPKVLKELKSNCRVYAEKHFGQRNAKLIEESYRIG